MQSRIIVLVTLSVLVGCHGDDSGDDGGVDAAATDAETVDATRPPSDSGSPPVDECLGSDAAAATPTTVSGGSCVEGMQCIGISLACGGFPPCVCVGGAWQCTDAGSPSAPLPTRDPQECERCNQDSLVEVNFACTLPDVCGGLCACFKGKWICAAVDGGGGAAGPDCPVSACSVLSPNYGASDGGCFSPYCSTIGRCDCQEH